MDLPRRFPYNPQWRGFFFFFAPAIVVLLLGKFHWAAFVLAIPFAAFSLMLAMRRLLFPRFIRLEQDGFLLPTGFFRLGSTKISYSDIELTQQTVHKTKLFQWIVFRFRTKERKFEIISTMLPDMASYVAIRDFINSRATPKEEPKVSEPGKYCFQCSYEGDGKVYSSIGEILWHVKTLHFRRPRYPYGLFRLPDFVVYDTAEKELYRIKRKRSLLFAEFMMIENGLVICIIKQKSIFWNKYTLEFADGQKWIFRMPLFSVNFGGVSETGAQIRVRLWAHNTWLVLVDVAADNPQLVAALSFIHRERLRCN